MSLQIACMINEQCYAIDPAQVAMSLNFSIHSFIHSSVQLIFIELLPYTGQCTRFWEYSGEEKQAKSLP